MKAFDANLLELLRKTNQFEVPIYQRAYAWGRGECDQLWNDIVRAGRTEQLGAHFTGSVVYVEKETGTSTHSAPNLLIDGQQRVTTVTLILAALAARLELLDEDAREPIDGFSPVKIRGRYLLNQDEEGERRFKLILSQGDRANLMTIVDGGPVQDQGGRLGENYQRFSELMESSEVDLAEVSRGLSKLTIVDIRLQLGVDHPQLVFEAMNSTGKKLSQADLIRNFVLMDLHPRDQRRLYEQFWRPMELDFGPAAYETRFDEFVRHYLTVMTGSIPRLGDVYEAFKVHANVFTSDGDTIESLVSQLREYARIYCAMALGTEKDAKLAKSFKDLAQIRADVVYPFLLEVYTDYNAGSIDVNEFLEIVEMVIAYLFRRAVVRVPTNSLNTTFATFARGLRKANYVESVKAQFLRMQSYRRFPADEEFVKELKYADLYHFQRASYLFRLLENFKRKEHVSVEEYTIEHILPQNEKLRPEWRESLGPDWKAVQEKYLHTLGNLTLTGYNSEYSDRPFVQKRDMTGGFRESPLRVNEGLGDIETWNAESIEARAAQLARKAVKIWKRPSLDEQTLAEHSKEDRESGFTIEDHPHLLRPERRDLFDRLSVETLALDPAITRHYLKHYVAFKNESNFVDVVPQLGRLRLSLSIPIEALRDERELAYDVSSKGHWGNGETEVTLDESSDFTYVMGLIRQAYEYQLGGDS